MSGGRKVADAKRMSLTRRALLKTTPHALVGCIAFAIVYGAAATASASPGIAATSHIGAMIMAQSSSSSSEDAVQDKHQQAADLLYRARQAMDQNDLAAADTLISEAESLGVRYGRLHFGDTPKKARCDLERKRNADGKPTKPSRLFSPFSFNRDKQAPGDDPFKDHPVEQASHDAERVQPLPR